jgi:hypothetical protein
MLMREHGRSFLKQRLLLLLLGVLLTPVPSFAQSWLEVWPEAIHIPPAEPYCYTIWVPDGAYMTLDLEIEFPWGHDYVFGWPTLDESGQAYVCADSGTVPGRYVFVGVRNSEYYWAPFTPVYAVIDVIPPAPPVITSAGSGCDNWDCIWVTGSGFKPDSQVFVYSANWAYQETYYGPAWQTSPSLVLSGDGRWLAFQLVDPNLRWSFGWDGVYFVIVNSDGGTSSWDWVRAPQPVVHSHAPSCADSYCLTFSGDFPLNAVVDFRVPGGSDVLPNAYSDLVVTPSQLTLRLNPSVRYAFDTSGLNAWVVNPGFPNWSGEYYFAPVDRSVGGWFSGISQQGSEYYLYGWACAKTYPGSIDLHVYVGGPAGGGGTYVLTGTANAPSEPGVAQACNTTGANFRFWLQIPPWIIQQYPAQPIHVYGISPYGLPNLPLNRAGDFTVPGMPSLSHREFIYFGNRLLAVDAQ